jgi:uncharacterized protein (TIGR02001 family)
MFQMHSVSCKQHKSDICYKGFNVYKIYIETLSLTNLIIKGIKMNKKIILSSFASLLFLSQAVNAEIKVGQGSLTFNASVASQYIARGVDQNKDSVTPSVGADLTYPAGGFNLYVGAWVSGSDFNAGAGGQERDVYLGVNKTFGITTLDLGFITYTYPGINTASKESNNAEYYVKLTVAPEKKPYTFGAAYYQDDTGGVKNGTRKLDRNYYEVNATYDFGVVQSSVSYGIFDNDTQTTTVSLSKEFAGIGFTLSYIDAQKEDATLSQLNKNRDYVTLSAKKTF